MKKKKGVQRSHDRCKGRGANGHMTFGGKGGGGGGEEGGPARPATLGLSDPSSVGPSGMPLGFVRPAQYKACGLAAGLKKK